MPASMQGRVMFRMEKMACAREIAQLHPSTSAFSTVGDTQRSLCLLPGRPRYTYCPACSAVLWG